MEARALFRLAEHSTTEPLPVPTQVSWLFLFLSFGLPHPVPHASEKSALSWSHTPGLGEECEENLECLSKSQEYRHCWKLRQGLPSTRAVGEGQSQPSVLARLCPKGCESFWDSWHMCFRERGKATELGNRVIHTGMVSEAVGRRYLLTCWSLPTLSTLQPTADRLMTQQEPGATLPSRENRQHSQFREHHAWSTPETHSVPWPEISNLSKVMMTIWPTWRKLMSLSLACEKVSAYQAEGNRLSSIAHSHVVFFLSLRVKSGTITTSLLCILGLWSMKHEEKMDIKFGKSLVPSNICTYLSLHWGFYYDLHIHSDSFKSGMTNL